MTKSEFEKLTVTPDISIRDALKRIGDGALKILFVTDENQSLIGSLTDGDIRRRVLQNGSLQESISECFNLKPFTVEKGISKERIRKFMLEKTLEVIPEVDEQKRLINVHHWDEIFDEEMKIERKLSIPVVIMAGGKGERLGPFTKILPKPLIPIGETPIIEKIMDKFARFGVGHFYFTLNYKGSMVKTYFDSIEKSGRIDYIWEEEFLGTAGSLKLLPQDISQIFIVSNCDIIVDSDYVDLVDFHQRNENVLTVVGAMQHHRIPYGVIHFQRDGKIDDIQEKPEFDFTVNTGVYVLNREVISHIPDNQHFDMTDLIKRLLKENQNVGVYPINQKSYIDIGQLEEYKKYTEKLL